MFTSKYTTLTTALLAVLFCSGLIVGIARTSGADNRQPRPQADAAVINSEFPLQVTDPTAGKKDLPKPLPPEVVQAQDKKDPQSAYEPRSKPGVGQKFLEKFVGDWDVVKTFHPRSGDPVQVKGECRQVMIHEGRFLRSQFTFQQGQNKTTGEGLVGFEAESGLFTSVWTDVRSTRMSLRRSQDKFNGEEIVLYSRELEDGGREARRSRTVTRLEANNNKIVHRQYALTADAGERLMMEIVMTRKVNSAPAGN